MVGHWYIGRPLVYWSAIRVVVDKVIIIGSMSYASIDMYVNTFSTMYWCFVLLTG